MSGPTDWRYRRLEFLRGAEFQLARYRAPDEQWDHDHCNGCWAKFADFDGPGILHEGYVHARPYEPGSEPEFITQSRASGMTCLVQPAVDGFELQWVCARCYEDFRELLEFRTGSGAEPSTSRARDVGD